MAIAEGTYRVLCALDVTKALDVTGSSDASGANVQVWTSQATKDGQYVTVTGTGTYQVLRFPLTGRVLAVAASTAKNAANVVQQAGNGGTNQSWHVKADGSSVYVDGVSYPTYVLKSALDEDFVLDAYGHSAANGTNIVIYNRTYYDNQRWVFIPVPTIPKGTYRFVSVLDRKSCLSAANLKDGGNVILAGIDTADNKQVWRVGSTGTASSIVNCASKCYMRASSATSGSTVDQGASAQGLYTTWLASVAGSAKHNGATCPIIRFQLAAGDALSVDVAAGGDKAVTDVKVCTERGVSAQQFIAVPANPVGKVQEAALPALPAPSSLGLAYAKGGDVHGSIWGVGKVSAIPAWVGNGSRYQIRARWRYRKVTAGDTSYGAWSAWQWRGNTANEGWGDVTKANIAPTLARDEGGRNRRYSIAQAFTLRPDLKDAVEYQWQVRRFEKGRAGNAATHTGHYYYRPTFSLRQTGGFTWAPDGLHIQFSSDQKRNGNDLTVYRLTCTHDGRTVTMYDGGKDGMLFADVRWNDSVTVPQSKLRCVPMSGDTIAATIRFANVDGAYMHSKENVAGACSWGAGYGLIVEPTTEITEGKMLHVTCKVTETSSQQLVDADSFTCWVDYGDDQEGMAKYPDSDGEWYIPVQFGRSYRLYVMARKGAKWDVANVAMPAVASPGSYWLNFANPSTGEQDYAQVKVSLEEPPAFVRAVAYDADVQFTNGDAYEVVHFGHGRSEGQDLGGIVPLRFSVPHSTVARIEQLGRAHYAWLRGPSFKEAYRVAVMGLNVTLSHPGHADVSLSLKRIDNPTDW